jgi:hypothetical protein
MTRFILIATLAIGQLAVAQPLQYETRHVERTLPGCGNQKNGCAHAELNYVEVVSGPPVARQRINAAIVDFVANGAGAIDSGFEMTGDGRSPRVATPAVHLTPQEAADDFINTYEKFRADSKLRGSFTFPASESRAGARRLAGAPLRPEMSIIQWIACIINGPCAEHVAEDAETSPNPIEASGAFGTGLFSTLLEPVSERFAAGVGMLGGLLHFQEAVDSELQGIGLAADCNASTSCTSSESQAIENAVTSSGLSAVVSELAGMLHVSVAAGIAEMGLTSSASLVAIEHIVSLESSGAVQSSSSPPARVYTTFRTLAYVYGGRSARQSQHPTGRRPPGGRSGVRDRITPKPWIFLA